MLAYLHARTPCSKGSIDPEGSGAHGATDLPCPLRLHQRQAKRVGKGLDDGGRHRRGELVNCCLPHIVVIIDRVREVYTQCTTASSPVHTVYNEATGCGAAGAQGWKG